MSEKLTKKSITSQEICDIIKTCSTSGVSKLKFGDFSVEFNGGPDKITTEASQPPVSAATIAAIQATASEESLLDQTLIAKDDEIAQMLIEDPLRAEQLIQQGDFEDETGGSDS